MLADLLKSESFSIAFSLLLGIGIWAILRPSCTSNSCATFKAPPIKDFGGKTFRLSSSCYKFKATTKDCPAEGYIEPFYENQLRSATNRFAKIQVNGTTESLGTFAVRD